MPILLLNEIKAKLATLNGMIIYLGWIDMITIYIGSNAMLSGWLMIRSMYEMDTIERAKESNRKKARAGESRKERTKRHKERRTKGLHSTAQWKWMNMIESGCVKAQPCEEQWKVGNFQHVLWHARASGYALVLLVRAPHTPGCER